MATLSVIASGVETNISDGSLCYVLGDDGFGMAPSHDVAERGPMQHGETFKDFRLDPRTLSLVLGIEADSKADLDDRRDALLRLFRPSRSVSLRKILDNGETRQIDCRTSGGLPFSSQDRVSVQMKVAVMLKAHDPTWYDPTQVTVNFGVAGGGSGFAVPTAIPSSIGSSTLDQTKAITYGGSWRTHPVILIYGPITDPIIENETTGETLDFTGITIAGGDYYTIDTRYGQKQVYRNGDEGDSKISELSDDSDLVTFHLASDDESAGGANSLRATGSGITAATAIYVRYYKRYVGH